MATGRLAAWLAMESVAAIRQLPVLPSRPQYCRATPAECTPFLAKPVSSTIQASIGPPRASIAGKTRSRTLPGMAASDHEACPTKCSNDCCPAGTRDGATRAAIGSTRLRSPGIDRPVQWSFSGRARSTWPRDCARDSTCATHRASLDCDPVSISAAIRTRNRISSLPEYGTERI